jgi:hypothetical protein
VSRAANNETPTRLAGTAIIDHSPMYSSLPRFTSSKLLCLLALSVARIALFQLGWGRLRAWTTAPAGGRPAPPLGPCPTVAGDVSPIVACDRHARPRRHPGLERTILGGRQEGRQHPDGACPFPGGANPTDVLRVES